MSACRGANSGLFLRVDPGGLPVGQGQLKVQLIDDAAFPKLPEIMRNGSLFNAVARSVAPPFRLDEWNWVRVRLDKRRMEVRINDVQTIDTDLDSARDQFSKIPGLMRSSSRIGLQTPGKTSKSPIAFRNARIKVLGEQPPPELTAKERSAQILLDAGARMVLKPAGRPNVHLKRGDVAPAGPFVIREIDLSGIKTVSDEFLKNLSLTSLVDLEVLNLSGTSITDVTLNNLQGCQKLRRLLVCKAPVTGKGLAFLAALPKLESLELDECKKIDNAGFQSIKLLKGLKHLSLCLYVSINDKGLTCIKDLPLLESVELMNSEVNGSAFLDLRGMKTLTSIDLRASRLNNAGLAAVLQMPNLRRLELHFNDFGYSFDDAGMKAVRGRNNLRYLGLGKTKLTDACIPHLSTLTNLEELVISETRITPAGVERLRAALPNCKIKQ